LKKKIRKNTKLIIEYAKEKNIKPHDAGIAIAKQRVKEGLK